MRKGVFYTLAFIFACALAPAYVAAQETPKGDVMQKASATQTDEALKKVEKYIGEFETKFAPEFKADTKGTPSARLEALINFIKNSDCYKLDKMTRAEQCNSIKDWPQKTIEGCPAAKLLKPHCTNSDAKDAVINTIKEALNPDAEASKQTADCKTFADKLFAKKLDAQCKSINDEKDKKTIEGCLEKVEGLASQAAQLETQCKALDDEKARGDAAKAEEKAIAKALAAAAAWAKGQLKMPLFKQPDCTRAADADKNVYSFSCVGEAGTCAVHVNTDNNKVSEKNPKSECSQPPAATASSDTTAPISTTAPPSEPAVQAIQPTTTSTTSARSGSTTTRDPITNTFISKIKDISGFNEEMVSCSLISGSYKCMASFGGHGNVIDCSGGNAIQIIGDQQDWTACDRYINSIKTRSAAATQTASQTQTSGGAKPTVAIQANSSCPTGPGSNQDGWPISNVGDAKTKCMASNSEICTKQVGGRYICACDSRCK